MQKRNPGKKKYRQPDPQPVVALEGAPPPPPEMLSAGVLIPVFVLATVLGYVVFHRQWATKAADTMSTSKSVFAAVNLATLTGFQQSRNPSEYTPRGQWTAVGLMWAGALFSVVGGGLAVKRIMRLRLGDGQFAAAAVIVFAAIVGIGFVALLSTGAQPFPSLFLSTSAAANCGLTIEPSAPPVESAVTHLVLMPLSILGGIGVPVLLELIAAAGRWTDLSKHTRTVLQSTAVAFAGGFFVLLVLKGIGTSPFSVDVWRSVLGSAAVQAINTRSAGFDVEAVGRMPQSMTAVMTGLMTAGACPGGTGGGIKLTTLVVVGAGVVAALRGRPVGRAFGLAAVWTGMYLAALAVVAVTLLITEPQIHLDRTLFLTAAAVGNVGLSHNPIDLSDTGMFVLSVAMLAGRIGPVLMLWHVAETAPDAEVATA